LPKAKTEPSPRGRLTAIPGQEASEPSPAAESAQPGAHPRLSTSPRHRRALQIGFALAALLVGIGIVYLIRDVIGAFVLGALVAFLIGPLVDRLVSFGIPRSLSIVAVFIALLVVLAALASMFVPLLISEASQLQAQAPTIAASAQDKLTRLEGQPFEVMGFRIDLSGTTDQISTHANEFLLGQFGNALSLGLVALGTLLQVLLMLLVAFLIAYDQHRITLLFRRLVPPDYRDDFDSIWAQLKRMLHAYMRGQLIIAAMIGIASGVACQLLGLPYAFALGVLAGLTSLVPYLGPFVGAVPAILVALAISPLKAIEIGVLYFLISNVILNFFSPKIVGDAVRLPPILVIVAFIAGFSLAGILGMFIAVPIAASIRILFDYLYPRLYGSAA
jgi:predicted PurR-regulated permease PerM